MYATKLTLLLTAIVLYVAGSTFWFFWQVPELLSTGTDQTLVAAFAGTVAWMLLTFGFIIHIIKTARPTAAGGRQ
ncbi:hypothetical protein HBO07_19490 [Pseudomonas proteolytica]|uniref:hypothetical protein n=1 Tax=Pseudomonas TaxID=286 RepID=UPI0014752334|nr:MULTISPECIES: hypothetical protein [Pseudomonas]NMY86880.1 hypothetical protein [Pseudomonas sp. WS 5411]NMZ13468.1 hypothetical protein [Pseudomonas proteolytica]